MSKWVEKHECISTDKVMCASTVAANRVLIKINSCGWIPFSEITKQVLSK